METIKGLQRPLVVLMVICTIIVLGIYLGFRYGDAQMARDVVIFILGAGGVITGFLFRDRVKTK